MSIADRYCSTYPWPRMYLCVLLLAMLPLTSADLLNSEHLKKFTLHFHNQLRKGEGAADMIHLSWSNQLAEEANEWSKQCVFEHQMRGRGENLAFDSNPRPIKELIQNEMQAWFDEKKDFSRYSDSCGSSCHYTQMVWANTTHVGCAARKCDNLSAFGSNVENAIYLVCFYNPKGNIGNNIYTVGEACSKCPANYHCKNELCHGKHSNYVAALDACGDLDTNCQYWSGIGECQRNPVWMEQNCRISCRHC